MLKAGTLLLAITLSCPITSVLLDFHPVNLPWHLCLQMQNPNCLVMVDNCYGEFVESIEPPMVVCDIFCIPGSLEGHFNIINACTGCRFDCRQFDKKSWWNHCTMRWICCREGKMGKSSCCSSLCSRAWGWLWLNSRWYYESFFPGVIPFTSNGWWGNQGTGFCMSS